MSADRAKPPSHLPDLRAHGDGTRGASTRQLQSLATIGQVAVGVGHELRNYLIPISAHAQLAAEVVDDPEARDHLESIQRAAQRCRTLVDQVIAAGRSSSAQTRPLSIGNILQDTLPLLRAAIPRVIELKVAVGENVPLVDTDPASIEQLVLNLVLNAAKALSTGYGAIEISVRARQFGRSEHAARLATGGTRSGVRLTVRDNGVGMDPSQAGRIFDPWFTSWRESEGAGLGLAIVRDIVQRHHGEIHVETAPGAGAAFHIDLPASSAP
jgi:signal transduction histidine kinase